MTQRLSWRSLRPLGIRGRVRPEERSEVTAAFVTLFGFMTGHALLETARDALFLARLPARQLPWVYLAIAVLALAMGQREPRVVRRLSGGNELARWLLAAAAVTLTLWTVVSRPWAWAYYALYIWSGVLATLVVIRFWTVLGSRFTLAQAKRIFPLIASGSVAGAIVGSGAARALTMFVPAQHLVLAAGLVLLVTARAPTALGDASPGAPAAQPDDLRRVVRLIWGQRYLRRVAAVVLLATVTFTLVDFVFKSAADRFIAPDRLGAFFSSVYLTLNVLSLLIQLLGVTWLLRRAGLIVTTAVMPALLLATTVGFTLGGGLMLALVLKGVDGALRHSLHRTATELLFLPLSERLRTRVKGFIDVLGQRGGQALASIVILMVLSSVSQERVFSALACVTALAWLAVALSLKAHYLDIFRQTLHEDGRTDVGLPPFPALDIASLDALRATLDSPDDKRVIAALSVLHDQGKHGVVPSLILYHPSPAVVIRGLDVLQAGSRADAVPLAERLLQHPHAGVRAAALRMLSAVQPKRDILEAMTADPDPAVAVTAEVAMLAHGWIETEDGRRRVLAALDRGGRSIEWAVAAAVRARPVAATEAVILQLLAAEHADSVRDAVAAAAQLRSAALFDPLMRLLSRRAAREDTRAALAGYGHPGMTRMAAALRDPEMPIAVRRHLPGAIALVGSPQAPDLLLRHLAGEPDGLIRFKILRALGRWRTEQPDLPLDYRLLADALRQALSTGYRLMEWRRGIERSTRRNAGRHTELRQVLVALLRDKQNHALERVFRLLNLQSGSDEFQRLYRGLHSPRAGTRASSRELLRHLVPPPIRQQLLPLVEDLHGEDDVASESPRGAEPDDDPALFTELVNSGLESVSALAAALAAELGMRRLAPALAACEPLSEEHGRTIAQARAILTTEPS